MTLCGCEVSFVGCVASLKYRQYLFQICSDFPVLLVPHIPVHAYPEQADVKKVFWLSSNAYSINL